jgi:hypothetical protein
VSGSAVMGERGEILFGFKIGLHACKRSRVEEDKKSTLCGKYLGQLQKKTEMKIMRSRYLPSSKGSTQFRSSYGL